MPHYFFSDETVGILKDALGENIDNIERDLNKKRVIWNTLLDQLEQIPENSRIVPQELGEIPDALKDIAKKAMDEHQHVHAERDTDEREPSHDTALKNMIEKYDLPKKITKDTLCIAPFEFPRGEVKNFKRLVFYEVPKGYSAALRYINGTVFVDRRLIMGLPYPMPPGLLKNSGIASNGCTAIRLYREYLFREATTAVSKSTNDSSGNGVQESDEWMYHKILNTDTSTKNYDGNKIEGDLE